MGCLNFFRTAAMDQGRHCFGLWPSCYALRISKEEVDASSRKEVEARIKMKELEFEAKNATMKATIEQQVKEIQHLKETITTLKEEISQQRSLTKSVAEASQGHVTQNFGKNQ